MTKSSNRQTENRPEESVGFTAERITLIKVQISRWVFGTGKQQLNELNKLSLEETIHRENKSKRKQYELFRSFKFFREDNENHLKYN